MGPTVPALAYVRSLPGEPATFLRAQASAIRQAVTARRFALPYDLVWVIRDEAAEQPNKLGDALRRLEAGSEHALFITRWDRIGRDGFVTSGIQRHAVEFGWALEVLNDTLDSVTDDAPTSNLRSTRTIEGLAEARAHGIRLGRPRSCEDEVLWTVVEEHLFGARQVDIAQRLNEDRTPTPGGGLRWYASHVSRLLRTQDAQAYLRLLLKHLNNQPVGSD